MTKVLLLSNGHGEDLSGALIGEALRKLEHQVEALPLVGLGIPYKDAEIKLLSKGQEFSTGGLGYTSIKGRITELFQGQIIYLLKKIWLLLLTANQYDLIVVIGDVIPILAARLSGRPTVAYLVAYSSHYEGRLKLPWPSKICLKSRHLLGIFCRDQLTADDLTIQLNRHVSFLGNPFMDPVLNKQEQFPKCKFRIGLLPGSRRPELEDNLIMMLKVVNFLPEELFETQSLKTDLALVKSLNDNELETLISRHGWQISTDTDEGPKKIVRGRYSISVRRGSFSKVLQSSDLLLCMAGTAAEQAIGLAKPVLQMPGNGPQFTASFAEAQRRLLGPTIFCASKNSTEADLFKNTAKVAVNLLQRIKEDRLFQKECELQAKKRLGISGGGERLAKAISELLAQNDYLPFK